MSWQYCYSGAILKITLTSLQVTDSERNILLTPPSTSDNVLSEECRQVIRECVNTTDEAKDQMLEDLNGACDETTVEILLQMLEREG